MRSRGYTLVEIMMVIAVILIIGGAAFSGAGRSLARLRFNNAFNKLVLVTQQARNFATTSKAKEGVDVVQYGILLASSGDRAQFFADDGDGLSEDDSDGNPATGEFIDYFQNSTNESTLFIVSDTATGTPCPTFASIFFTLPEGKARLVCGVVATPFSDSPFVSQLTVGIQETQENGRTKTFTIHEASGLPQL